MIQRHLLLPYSADLGADSVRNIYMKRYDVATRSLEDETLICGTDGIQMDSVACRLGGTNGAFLVAWAGNGPGDDSGVFAQRFADNPSTSMTTTSIAAPSLGVQAIVTATTTTAQPTTTRKALPTGPASLLPTAASRTALRRPFEALATSPRRGALLSR